MVLEFKSEMQHLEPARRLRLGSDRRGIYGVYYSILPSKYLGSSLVLCTAGPETTRHHTSTASACQYPCSDKSVTFCLSRDATGGRSTHPLIPVTRNDIIEHIADWGGHQHAEIIQGPPPRELSDHPQRRCRLGIDMGDKSIVMPDSNFSNERGLNWKQRSRLARGTWQDGWRKCRMSLFFSLGVLKLLSFVLLGSLFDESSEPLHAYLQHAGNGAWQHLYH